MCLDSVAEPARPFLTALLARDVGRPVVAITPGLKEQERFHFNLATYAAALSDAALALEVRFYPPWETLPHEDLLPPVDVVAGRLKVLGGLARGSAGPGWLIVTSLPALLQRTFDPPTLRDMLRPLAVGAELDRDEFAGWLRSVGYEPEVRVTQKGEFSVRGGIVDLYPLDQEMPLRIELAGSVVESLRWFEPQTQVSQRMVSSVVLMPAGEVGLLKQRSEPLGSLLDFLPADTLFVMDEPAAIEEAAAAYARQVPRGDRFFLPYGDLRRLIRERPSGRLLQMGTEGGEDGSQAMPVPEIRSLEFCRPLGVRSVDLAVSEAQRRSFLEQLRQWAAEGYSVQVFCNNEGEQQRFFEILAELGMRDLPLEAHRGGLSQGFLFEEARLVVVTDAEIFGRYRLPRPRRLAAAARERVQAVADFTELEEGDFVVHVQHGIGRYLGLRTLETQSGHQEVLAIAYANDARLYVPLGEAHLISKYVGAGRRMPELSALGGTRWARARESAERAVMDLAASLLEVQAARASQPGFAYPPDSPWQREFENAFVYEETPDQAAAIAEVKRDMESSKPMDRLICGDVGYGKTEVAVRAAFKAVLAGKQVAVLVPTTVLAQQHYTTFCERMADYPVRIEMLSRFRSRGRQRDILRRLREGGLDIVIGTHRLLQPDVQFRDLGLVVIDEEQRFGVLHKERFKQLRRLVDVLTLSATPIPRTLHLSLLGARDMSLIQTPPADRLPVETIITEWNEQVVRDAILRELGRGGQVYYLHNRVETIAAVRDRLQHLLRHAERPVRIEIGHGQMPEDELESVMLRFVNGETDILVCTTIIESGLDIPNVNTILIDRADRFGLSDLYQLRGRVGRWKHKAYAYLLIPRHAALLADARKRIAALRQYSQLGSGFKIALRDLEIRGAGNLLGPEQSGHISAVGFELYCQLLRESIARLKGQPIPKRPEVALRLDFLDPLSDRPAPGKVAASIPHDYIAEPSLRVEAYRKLAQVASEPELRRLRQEWRDRFGPLPPAAELLLDVAALKLAASDAGIAAVEVREDRLMLSRGGDYVTVGGRFPRLTAETAADKLRQIRRFLASL